MKRFLDNKIITAQISEGSLVPIFERQTAEGQISSGINEMSDAQKSIEIDTAIQQYDTNLSNARAAKSIFVSNGFDSNDYDSEVTKFASYSIPKLQFDNMILSLWPKVQDKNITFPSFLAMLNKAADRYKSSAAMISFFDNFFRVLPDLSKTLGTSDTVISKALDFLLSGKSAEEFQKYLLYHMIKSYALFNKIPENKQADIVKATEQLENLRSDISVEEQEFQRYQSVKAKFLDEHLEYFNEVTEALMDIRRDNFISLIGLMRTGINEEKIKGVFKNLKRGDFFNLLRQTNPYLPSGPAGKSLQGTKPATGHFSDKIRRRIFAADERRDIGLVTNTSFSPPVTSPITAPLSYPNTGTPVEPTQSGAFSELYGKFVKQINEFESAIMSLSKQVDSEINYILTKQSTSQQVGPFSAGNVFQYLQDDEESLLESERVIGLIDELISFGSNLKSDLKKEVQDTQVGANEARDKEFTLTTLDEKFNLFRKDMLSKQLGLKFNKVLIAKQNDYSEAEDLYNNLKIDMENNVSARPIIAPKAVLAGFRMADILESIAEEFKSIAGNNPLRAEQAMKTARRWENFAKQQRATVFTEIYPAMAQSIGIEATKPTISPSFSLRGAFVDNVINLRTAGKFMNKEVESDKKFRDYWNNLFMQSKDPRPMGDIIEEKPKHGNLTTEEDAKLHKKTMRKFKKTESKKPRFKKDNN